MTALHQLPSHHIQCLLRSEPADAFAVTGEIALHHLGATITGQDVEDEANGFFRRAARRSGHTRDADTESRAATLANSFGESGGHFAAYGSVFLDHIGRNTGERSLQLIRVNDGAANKIARTATDRCNPLRQ